MQFTLRLCAIVAAYCKQAVCSSPLLSDRWLQHLLGIAATGSDSAFVPPCMCDTATAKDNAGLLEICEEVLDDWGGYNIANVLSITARQGLKGNANTLSMLIEHRTPCNKGQWCLYKRFETKCMPERVNMTHLHDM